MEERDLSKFQSVRMTDIPKVVDLLQLNIFLYDIDFVDGVLIGELARRSIRKFEKSVKQSQQSQQSHLLRQQHQRIVQSLPMYYTFFSKTGNLE